MLPVISLDDERFEEILENARKMMCLCKLFMQ